MVPITCSVANYLEPSQREVEHGMVRGRYREEGLWELGTYLLRCSVLSGTSTPLRSIRLTCLHSYFGYNTERNVVMRA